MKAVDTYSWQVLEDLRTQAAALSEEEFGASVNEFFVTFLSDGSEIELCPGGKSKQVTLENLNEYIDLVIDKRLNEAQKQVEAVLEGINFVIPINYCRLLNWR